ncbi:MAG: 6-phosphofructokinase [Acidimicrobiia bacterium]|nr:6-phosphofructokinase [Acidimicrobiia bacterium]
MAKQIGILTAGGDSPGLNAAIRAVGKAAIRQHGMNVIGFKDGFRGLMQNRFIRLTSDELSGILTKGGTILGAGRDKPHRMDVGGTAMDMTDQMLQHVRDHQLDALVCIGGGGTQKNALRLAEKGVPIVTLPKTIDNDVWGTDTTFGFDTALGIATEAIDRLHSTAHSHHRIVVVEIMGHNTGWLALGSGLAGGADVILIPEIPYDIDEVAGSILDRRAAGSTFSIVAVSEGARSRDAEQGEREYPSLDGITGDDVEAVIAELAELRAAVRDSTGRMSRTLEEMTGLEARVTILGHVQRGGMPSPEDRLLATILGVAVADVVADGGQGVMVGIINGRATTVPLTEVAGKLKTVPLDHKWITTARNLGVSMGDKQAGTG